MADVDNPLENRRSSGSLWVWLTVATVTTVALVTAVFWIVYTQLATSTTTTFDIARTTATFVGILGAALLAAIAIRRQQSAEDAHGFERERHDTQQARLDAETDRAVISALRERYTTAAAQLGHDNSAIRLAGVYALAALADDWLARSQRSETQTCIEVLCSILRSRSAQGLTDHQAAADLELRQTIVRVITAHLQPDAENYWSGFNFDFTNTIFNGRYGFDRAEFTGGDVSFDRAKFTGGAVWFGGVKFSGAEVTFDGAEFTGGQVAFFGVKLTGGLVSFRGAKFTAGGLAFIKAELTGGDVSFDRSEFTGGHISFVDTMFAGGHVDFGAKFIGADISFDRSEFTGGIISFSSAEFTGGKVSFADAKFTGGHVNLGAKFTGGEVTFPGAKFDADSSLSFGFAKFIGGHVSFPHAEFSGGRLLFVMAEFSGGSLTFPQAKFIGGVVLFADAQYSAGEVSFQQAHGTKDAVGGSWKGKPPPDWPH